MARLRGGVRLALIVLGALAVGAGGAFVGLTRTHTGQTWFMTQVLQRVEGGLQGQVVFGSVHSAAGLHRQATLVDVEVRDAGGGRVFTADSLRASYSVSGILAGDIVLRDVDLWNPLVRVSRAQLDVPFSIHRVLTPPADTTGDSSVRSLVLENVGVHSGRLEIRDPMPDNVPPGRVRAERSLDADGWIRTLDFEGIDARLARVGIIDPEVPGISVEVAGLTLEGQVFDEPLHVVGFSGRVRYRDKQVTVGADQFRMPAGTRASGVATVDLQAESPEVSMDLTASELDTRDFRWLLPDLPDASGATAINLVRDANSLRVRLTGGSLDFGGGALVSGEATLTWSGGSGQPILSQTAIELDELDTSIVEDLLDIEIPFGGVLGGSLMVDGTVASPLIDGTLTHRSVDLPLSTVDLSGRLLLGDDPGADNLDLTLHSLSLGVVDAYAQAGLDPFGMIEGTVSLDGLLSTGLSVDFHADLPGPAGEASLLDLSGTVDRIADEMSFDLSGEAESFDLAGIVPAGSPFARLGRASGSIEVRGPLSALTVVADLAGPRGRLAITTEFDGRDPFAGYQVEVVADDYDTTALIPELPEGTVLNGRLDVAGQGRSLDEAVLTASARFADAKIARLAVDSMAFEGTVRDGLIQIDSLQGVIGGTRVTGAGTLGTSRARSGRLDLALETDDLEGIRPYFLGENIIAQDTLRGLARDILVFDGIDPDTLPFLDDVRMSGSASAQLVLSGALDSLSVSGDLTVADAVYAESFIETAHVTFTAEGLPTVSPRIAALVETGGIRILDRAFDSASVRLDYLEPRGRTDVFLVRGDREDYRAHIAFDWSDSVRVLNLDEMTLRFPEERWNLGGPATVSWDPDGLTFDDLRLIRPGVDGFRLTADGRLPFRGSADFGFSLQQLELERVRHILQLPDRLEGIVDLDLRIDGTAEAPEFEGTLSADEFRFKEYSLDQVRTDFDYVGRRLSGEVLLRHEGREILAMNGAIPANLTFLQVEDRFPDEPVDLNVRADSLPLALLMAPFQAYDDVRGTISGSVSLGGTLEGLAPDGEIRLSDGGAYLESVGVRHQDVEAVVTFRPDGTAQLEGSLQARGSADVSGTVAFKPASNPSLDLQLRLRDFQGLERRDVEARLSGTIDISGTYRSPQLSGDLEVREGVLYVEEFMRSASVLDLGFLASDSTTSILNPEFLDVPSIVGGQNPFLRNVVMRNLTLRFTNNAWVQSDAMRVEMGGQLDVFYDRAQQEIALQGTLNALRGTYTYYRGFNVDQGTLRFFGTPGINPELDIQATSRLRTADREALNITANVTGTLISPRVALTSDHAGLSEGDLLAYMAFGRPAYGLTSSQSQALGAAGSLLVGSGVTLGLQSFSTALGSAASGLGLAYLSFTQQDLGALGNNDISGTLGTTVLETGRYVADDFFVTLLLRPLSSQGAGSTFAGLRLEWAASNSYTLEASVEERFFRGRVVGFGELGIEDQLGFGLFLFREWGY